MALPRSTKIAALAGAGAMLALPVIADAAEDAVDCAVLYRANWEYERQAFDPGDVSEAWRGMSRSYAAVAVRKGVAPATIEERMKAELADLTQQVAIYSYGSDPKVIRALDKIFARCNRILNREPEMAKWR